MLFLGARQVYVRSFCYIAPKKFHCSPVTANLNPTAQLEGWLPPPTPASGRSLLQVPAARVKINQHPPASCEQEKISPEEGALGHSPSDEEGRPLYQAVIIARAFDPGILEITLWVGGAQRQKTGKQLLP